MIDFILKFIYHFLVKNFNYGPYLCNGCSDMSLKAVSIENLAIINHNGNHYRVNFAFISKKDAYNLIKNATVREHYKCRRHKCFAFKVKNEITFVCAYYKDEFKKVDKKVDKKRS